VSSHKFYHSTFVKLKKEKEKGLLFLETMFYNQVDSFYIGVRIVSYISNINQSKKFIYFPKLELIKELCKL